MSFFAIFIALTIERFFDWSHVRSWTWLTVYARFVDQKLPHSSPTIIFAAIILTLVSVVILIQAALSEVIYGFPSFLFKLFTLLYCLGPKIYGQTFLLVSMPSQLVISVLRK